MLRLLLVHAHPDDETIVSGGTIAKYCALGVQIKVVTCTLGEEGEVMNSDLVGLTAQWGVDQLGGYRIGELREALAALSDSSNKVESVFLGGYGKFRDSGMAGSVTLRNSNAFSQSTVFLEATNLLRDELFKFLPQVVISYDPSGGYGHPDHIRAHEITACAVNAAPFIQKFYICVNDPSVVSSALFNLDKNDFPPDWVFPPYEEQPSASTMKLKVDINISQYLDKKRAALTKYTSQLSIHPTQNAFILTNRIISPIPSTESYCLFGGSLQNRVTSPEKDLFDGVTH